MRNVTRITAVYEAFAESSYDSEAVFRFPQQGHPTVGGYFVGVKAGDHLAGSLGFGIAFEG